MVLDYFGIVELKVVDRAILWVIMENNFNYSGVIPYINKWKELVY
jgi:hypothetical protein